VRIRFITQSEMGQLESNKTNACSRCKLSNVFQWLHPLSGVRYYNAVIDMLSEDGETCTVTFDGYGTTVIVKVMLS